MNNLLQIVIVIASVAVIALSLWGIMYFALRLAWRWFTNYKLGPMPSYDDQVYLWDELTGKWYYSPTVGERLEGE